MNRNQRAVTAATIISGGVIAASLAIALSGGGSQPSPQDILRTDGYSVVMTLSEAQMQAAAGPDTANLAPYVIDGIVGTCDGATCGGYGTEIVMRLTPAGVTFFGPNLDALRQSGYSVRMTGSDIVMRKN